MLVNKQIKTNHVIRIVCLFPLISLASPGKTHSKDIFSRQTYPQNQTLYDRYPWAFTYYYGIKGSDALARMFKGEFHRWPEHIQSLELAYTLNENNFLR